MSQSREISYERRLLLGLPFLRAGTRSMQARVDSFSELTRACDALAADLLEKKSLTPDEYLLKLASRARPSILETFPKKSSGASPRSILRSSSARSTARSLS